MRYGYASDSKRLQWAQTYRAARVLLRQVGDMAEATGLCPGVAGKATDSAIKALPFGRQVLAARRFISAGHPYLTEPQSEELRHRAWLNMRRRVAAR